jgi:CHASE3 domain sensor protein
MAIIWAGKFNVSSRVFNDMSRIEQGNLAHNSNASWNNARLNKNRDEAALLTGCGVALIGAVGIGWSFSF